MKTTWSRLHPATQWFYYMFSVVIGMIFFHPIALTMGVFILTGVHFYAFRQFRLGKWYKMAVLMIVLFAILNPIFSHRGSHKISMLPYCITWEAVLYGITWGLSLSMILLVFRLYQDLFSSTLFLALFHRFSPQWSLLLMFSIRFIPMFQRRLIEIVQCQSFRSKGKEASWKEKLKYAESQILTLIGWSLEDALQTVDSMKARGYAKGPRSSYHCYRFTGQDIFVCSVLFILLIVEICFCYYGYGTLQIYPQLGHIFPTHYEWIATGIECLILGTPFWYEGGEQLRWYIWKLQTRFLLTQGQKNRL